LINRITIPIYDNNGYLVAFSGRTIKKDVEPKYLNTSTTKLFSKTTTLFNFFNAKKYVDDKIIIVEGFMDAIAHVRAGFKNVVATMGVALSANHMNALSSLEYLKTVILSFDNDVAGIQATIENGRKLMENGFNVYVVGSYDKSIKDVDELIQKNGNIGICSIIENRIDFVTFLINNAFNKKMPLDEIQDSVNKIISYMVDFGNNSVLLKTQHLKLLAEKSNLNYEDIKQKYENDINKLQTADTKITHNKKIYKPTNNVGLNEKFYETEEQKNEEERPNVYKHMIGDLNNEIKMISRKLTQLYDYLIESILANPNQISKINNELNFNTQYEFIEQKLIIKAMLYLHTKGVGINSNELLKFLENKSNGSLEINWNYQKAFKYFNDFLNNPLLRFNQTIGNTKKQSRIDEIIKNIQISKYQIIILQERLNLYQLSITNKDANQKLIGELEDKITSLISNYKQFIKQSK
jgi:DNA primase